MNIKKLLVGAVTSTVMLIPMTIPAFATPAQHLNWGSQMNPTACDTSESPLVSVNYKILNDGDAQYGTGKFWAMDSFNRNLKVYDLGKGNYCAIVSESGKFVTQPGIGSPLPTDYTTFTFAPLDGGITGTVEGGYVALFTATAFNPTLATHGNLPTSDYMCNTDPNCTNAFDWAAAYFTDANSSSLNLTNWGWVYHAGDNGSMVQSARSNYIGNILNN